MTKSNLIMIGSSDLNYSHVEWIFNNYFNFIPYDPSLEYDKTNDMFLISRINNWHDDIIDKYLDRGFKLILANLWEARPYFLSSKFESYLDNILALLGCQNSYDYGWKNIINVPRWFWYNESLWYTCESRLQYQTYTPQRTNKKLFFMPMRRGKKFRNSIVERLNPYLNQSIYSYVEQWPNGVQLTTRENNPAIRFAWDRQFEPEWYNDTYFTIAVESAVDRNFDMELERTGVRPEALPCDLFVTEKTFKPIAFQHPFMVCGMPGILEFLKNNGFETYDHLFDESYDAMNFFEDRLECIYRNIENFDVEKYNDPMTQQKIQYNCDRFYNRRLVLDGIKKDLIQPMEQFFESK